MMAHERILVALDTPNAGWARELVQELSGDVGGFKIGLELFTSHGPEIVREVRDAGSRVFLDLKMHDIPNTVAGGAAAAARLGVSFLTLHALGGPEMIRRGTDAAAEAAEKAGFTTRLFCVIQGSSGNPTDLEGAPDLAMSLNWPIN